LVNCEPSPLKNPDSTVPLNFAPTPFKVLQLTVLNPEFPELSRITTVLLLLTELACTRIVVEPVVATKYYLLQQGLVVVVKLLYLP